jgi:hypothetical protein
LSRFTCRSRRFNALATFAMLPRLAIAFSITTILVTVLRHWKPRTKIEMLIEIFVGEFLW